MKNIFKTVSLLAFFLFSSLCSAQMFSVNELVRLSQENTDVFRKVVPERGYSNENITDNGLSISYGYSTMSGNSSISLVLPTFSSDIRMITWTFRMPSAYEELKTQLQNGNYTLTNTERRKAGKYVSLYYSRPGFDIILTSDKTTNSMGKYILSVKTTKISGSESMPVARPIESTNYNMW